MATKEWYLENKDKPEYKLRIKNNTQRWQEQNPEKYIISQAKFRANKNNIPFDLEVEDITIPEVCPILGISIFFGEGSVKPHSPSLDRINPKLGYVKGNVQIISQRANQLKGNASPEELLLLAKWIQNHS